MLGSNQKTFLLVLAENAPSIAFLATLQITGELRVAGWVGVVASAATLGTFTYFGRTFHPILLAINLYTLLATPVIEATYLLGLKPQGELMIAHIQVGVLASRIRCRFFSDALVGEGFCRREMRAAIPHASAINLALDGERRGGRVVGDLPR